MASYKSGLLRLGFRSQDIHMAARLDGALVVKRLTLCTGFGSWAERCKRLLKPKRGADT